MGRWPRQDRGSTRRWRMDVDEAQLTERKAAALQQGGGGIRPGLQRGRQADSGLAIVVWRLRPMPRLTVGMGLDPAVQMHAAVPLCMDVRVQQGRHALQQGEQEEDEAAATAGHGLNVTPKQPIVVERRQTPPSMRGSPKIENHRKWLQTWPPLC